MQIPRNGAAADYEGPYVGNKEILWRAFFFIREPQLLRSGQPVLLPAAEILCTSGL